MEVQRKGSKFLKIDVLADVYVRPENELTESLHATMVEKSQLVLQESASQLPSNTPIESMDPLEDAGFHIITKTLDQIFSQRPRTYSLTQEIAGLRSEMASYKSQMSMLVQAFSSSGIHLPGFSAPSPSQPFHTEQPIPNQQQDYQAPLNDMPIDFAAFFS
ncbi:unnamed protein product [Malus baccata var. baccata]